MRREDAVLQLQRVIGPRATIVVGSHRSGPRQRAAAKCEEDALGAQLEVLQHELMNKVAAFPERWEVIRLQHQIIRLEQQRSEAHARAQYYRYTFTTPSEHRATGRWWNRELVGTFYGPVALRP